MGWNAIQRAAQSEIDALLAIEIDTDRASDCRRLMSAARQNLMSAMDAYRRRDIRDDADRHAALQRAIAEAREWRAAWE